MARRTSSNGRRQLATGALVLAAGLVGIGTPASASASMAGGEFGQHVATCTQTMGFTGEMNPGMHQGFSGWSPDHTC